MMSSNNEARDITAAVVRGKEQPFVIEQARLRGPQDDEVLVRSWRPACAIPI